MNEKKLKLPPIKKIHEFAKSPGKDLEFKYFSRSKEKEDLDLIAFENKKEKLLNLYNQYKERKKEYQNLKKEGITGEKEFLGNLVIIEKILKYTEEKEKIDSEVDNMLAPTEPGEEPKSNELLEKNDLAKRLKAQNKELKQTLKSTEEGLANIVESDLGERYKNLTQTFANNEYDIEVLKYNFNTLMLKYDVLSEKINKVEQEYNYDTKELEKFKVRINTFTAKNEKMEIKNTELKTGQNFNRTQSLPAIGNSRKMLIERLNKELDAKCLLSESKEDSIMKKKKEIETLNKNIEQINTKCQGLSEELKSIQESGCAKDPQKEINELNDAISKKDKKIKDKKKKNNDLRKNVAKQLDTNSIYEANLEKEKIQIETLNDLLKDEIMKNKELEDLSAQNKEIIKSLKDELALLELEC